MSENLNYLKLLAEGQKTDLCGSWFVFFNVLFYSVLKGHIKFKCKYFGHISIMYSVCHLNRM